MNRYSNVYNLVIRLTDDPTLRAFFIPYLLCETDTEREVLNIRFWDEMKAEKEARQAQLRKAIQQSFLQLLPMSKELRQEVYQASSKHSTASAPH